MGAIFNILEQFRLESYYNQFFQLGVKDERDFMDGITDEDLNAIGEMNFNLKPKTVQSLLFLAWMCNLLGFIQGQKPWVTRKIESTYMMIQSNTALM